MKKTIAISMFFLATLLTFPSIGFALYPSSTPWSTYRHDIQHSGTTPSTAPNNNATAWTWGTPAAGSISIKSAPLIVDGRVILNVLGQAFGLDETNGIQLWNYQASGWLTAPSYADGRVFFGLSDNSGGVVCVNASTGQEIWKQDISPYLVKGSLIAKEDTVYIGATDNNTYAFDAATGHYKWGYLTNAPIYSSPAADGDLLFFGSDDAKLYALNVSGPTPVSIWNFTANGAIRSTPTIDNGRIFFGSDNHTLYALNETTSELIWTWATTDAAVKIRNGVAVANDIVYVTSEDAAKVYALHADAAPGNYTEAGLSPIRYWTRDLSSDYGVSGFNEPVYVNGKIIVSSTGGNPAEIYAFDADVGTTLWDRIVNWWPSIGSTVVADGRVWYNAYWWDPMSYTLYCLGEPFPATNYHYTINAGGTSFDVELETNSTVTNFGSADLETQGKIKFSVAGIGTTGMCNITLPTNMLNGPFNVTVDGQPPLYLADPTSNGTQTSLYFTYNHTTSAHAVEITGTTFIPEYTRLTITPLITIAFLLIVIRAKKMLKPR